MASGSPVPTIVPRRKEFPFGWALLAAVLLHAGLGLLLKTHVPLLSAAVAGKKAPIPPVTLRFVEVPPNATAVPEVPPATRYLSDKNRLAGPVVPPARIPPAGGGAAAAPSPGSPQRNVKQAKPASAPAAPAAPAAVEPDSSGGGIASGRPAPAVLAPSQPDMLAQSLNHLDRYLPGGGAPGEGGGGGPGDGTSAAELDRRAAGSGVYFDTQGYDLGPWANRVIAIVKNNWIIPVAADLGARGVVSVSFLVDRSSGAINNIQMIGSSGIPSFDAAAVSALRSSSPLPQLPPDFPREALPGVFRFYYNMLPPS